MTWFSQLVRDLFRPLNEPIEYPWEYPVVADTGYPRLCVDCAKLPPRGTLYQLQDENGEHRAVMLNYEDFLALKASGAFPDLEEEL